MFTNLYNQESTFWQADYTEEEFLIVMDKAENMFRDSDEVPCFSKGICDSTTAGYGRCDPHGYWEYPLLVNQDTLEIEL